MAANLTRAAGQWGRWGIDRLRAECLAWPLTGEEAFEHARPTLQWEDFNRGLEARFRAIQHGVSPSALTALRRDYFQSPRHREVPPSGQRKPHRGPVYLANWVMDQSRTLLECDGNGAKLEVRLRSLEESPRARHEALHLWRLLTLLTPPDFWVAARSAAEGQNWPIPRILPNLLVPSLARLLEEEQLASLHTHLGAACPFDGVWSYLLVSLAKDGNVPVQRPLLWRNRVGITLAVEEANAQEFHQLLLAAAIARMLVAWFVLRPNGASSFAQFLEALLKPKSSTAPADVLCGLCMACRLLLSPSDPLTRTLSRCPCRRPASLEQKERIQSLRIAYRWFFPNRTLPLPARTLTELRAQDPVLGLLHQRQDEREEPIWKYPEQTLIQTILGDLKQHPEAGYASLFWQSQRIRNLLYRELTQPPGSPGLAEFQRFFARIKPTIRGMTPELQMDMALDNELRSAPVRAWEIRVGADVTRNACQFLDPLVRSNDRLEAAVVMGFKKSASRKGAALESFRYQASMEGRRQEVLHLEHALDVEEGTLVRFLRGIDMCGEETAEPNWVVFPAVRNLRQKMARAASRYAPEDQNLAPRITFHAGEDYSSLHEGVRRIHETVDFGVVGAGDRVGHGLAVGMDVDAWADLHDEVPMPRQTRIDDLLWLCDLTSSSRIETDGATSARLRRELTQELEPLRPKGFPSIEAFVAGRRGRYQVRDETNQNFRPCGSPECTTCLFFDLTHSTYLDATVWVKPSSERQVLKAAQRHLREELARLGIVIEVMPSSNLLVSEMGSLERHPVFRLSPLDNEPSELGPRIDVVIADDDPITFSTSLGEEFAYTYAALLAHGISHERAMDWLARSCRAGSRSRFTLRPQRSKGRSE